MRNSAFLLLQDTIQKISQKLRPGPKSSIALSSNFLSCRVSIHKTTKVLIKGVPAKMQININMYLTFWFFSYLLTKCYEGRAKPNHSQSITKYSWVNICLFVYSGFGLMSTLIAFSLWHPLVITKWSHWFFKSGKFPSISYSCKQKQYRIHQTNKQKQLRHGD